MYFTDTNSTLSFIHPNPIPFARRLGALNKDRSETPSPAPHTRSFHLVSIIILSYRRPWPSARATDPVLRTRGAPDVIQSIYQARGEFAFPQACSRPSSAKGPQQLSDSPSPSTLLDCSPPSLPYPPALLNLGNIREESASEDDCLNSCCACCCCARCRVADAEGSGVRVHAVQEGEHGGAYLRTPRSSRPTRS